MIDQKALENQYEQYGGDAHYVFWPDENVISFEGIVTDSNAHKSIHHVGEPSQLSLFLHIVIDEEMHLHHITLAL